MHGPLNIKYVNDWKPNYTSTKKLKKKHIGTVDRLRTFLLSFEVL